jgi:hypothetical protein
MVPEPLHVDPERLAAAAGRLLAAANEIPPPPAPSAVTGSDPLSQAIAAQAGKVEAPVSEGLPAVKNSATQSAQNVNAAAKAYESTDQQLGDEINKRTFPDPERNGQRGKVRLAGFGTKPEAPPPPLPDPVTRLGLPNYNPGSLTGREARIVYTEGELRMRQLNEQLARQGVSAEERARQMCDLRNSLRDWNRDLMQNRSDAELLARYEKNSSFADMVARNHAKGLRGDSIYNAIIASSTRSRPEVNAAFGIDPEHPPPLPPVKPSNPIWDGPMMGGGGRFGEGGSSPPVTKPPPEPPDPQPPMMGGGGRF